MEEVNQAKGLMSTQDGTSTTHTHTQREDSLEPLYYVLVYGDQVHLASVHRIQCTGSEGKHNLFRLLFTPLECVHYIQFFWSLPKIQGLLPIKLD